MPQTVGRRAVLIGLAATLLPSPAPAQKPTPRIGWLSAGSEPDPFLEAFREGLQKLGYVEGQNVVLDIRHAHGNLEALRAGAAGLAQSKVALIVASLTAVRAARAVPDVPILFAISGEPIEAGLAKSLSRPGGNLTGSTFLSLEIAGKRVELLKEAFPRLRSLAALANTDHPGEQSELHATDTAARSLGIHLVYVPFRQSPFGTSPELDKALEAVRGARPDAMIVFPEGATMANRVSLASFAIAHRIPAMFGWSEYAAAGGADKLWSEPARGACTARRLRRQDPQGRQARGPPRRAAHEVRASDQPEDRQVARSHDPPDAASAGGPGDPVATPPVSKPGGQTMSIIAWIVLGLIAGFIGSKLVNKTGEGFFLDIGLGIVGAVIGGWLFNLFGMRGVTGLNIYSLIVAVIGAVVFLVVYHAIRRRTV